MADFISDKEMSQLERSGQAKHGPWEDYQRLEGRGKEQSAIVVAMVLVAAYFVIKKLLFKRKGKTIYNEPAPPDAGQATVQRLILLVEGVVLLVGFGLGALLIASALQPGVDVQSAYAGAAIAASSVACVKTAYWVFGPILDKKGYLPTQLSTKLWRALNN